MISRLIANSVGASLVFVFVAGTLYGASARPALQIGLDERVLEQVERFQSDDWRVREKAFYELLDVFMPDGFRGRTELVASAMNRFFSEQPAQKERIVTGLITLSERENAVSRNAAVGSLSEEFENYLGDLIAATAAIHDQRALDALVGELRSGNMASKAVAAFGTRAIDRVLAVLDLGDIADRIGAARTLAQMLDPSIAKIDGASRSKIKAGLLQASKDQHFAVRESAIIGLAKVPDRDITVALKELAERDPYSRASDRGFVFPVRDAAARTLAAR